MANKVFTVFQNLDKAISGNWDLDKKQVHNNTYDLSSYGDDVIYKTNDKEDYEKTKLELQQNRYLSNRWVKANYDLSVQAFAGLNNVKLMYRDADLMDSFPEIGAALDIISEECSVLSPKGQIVNVYSKSDRIKNVLEELFTNRLDLQVTAPMIIRAMCKYGNQFMLLNIDNKLGITGWRQLPVFNVERLENGIRNQFASLAITQTSDSVDMSTKFVWTDENNAQVPFRNWQIGHFRLLTDSIYLPYGVSYLHKARRHWRMLSLMEDMMLIYRLERSIERRVYKIFVGAIDDADVQAYIEEIADRFKRTPIVDPLTGQIDLRKNLLPVWKKTPIPLQDGRTITIEELAKEYEEGKENYVFSIQDKTLKTVKGKVVWCGKNYTANRMIKLTLGDGSYMVMAGEHEILMADGHKKRADECNIGELVMTYYVKKKKRNNLSVISNIEWVEGDDVYCMTVVGENGEDDRHNFALRTFINDDEWNENGCYVSNCVDQDIFIPVRDPNAPTPIDTLSAAQNLTAMDDIKYVQNKVLTALRIPKSFLNFEETTGDGKNLALMDIRFTRTVNRIQQAFLMELTKIASIHLYILGFTDELTNFSLSMNNPSNQAEQLEIDNVQKKITAIRDAVADPGSGIPIMSQTRALKEIMKWSDKDIQNNFEEIRLEKAIAAELEKTTQIIKKTGIFDTVDRIYGEPGAEYQDTQEGEGDDSMDDGMGGGGFGGGGFGGDDLGATEDTTDTDVDNLGNMGDDTTNDINGTEGEIPISDNNQQQPQQQNQNESVKKSRKKNKKVLNENKIDKFFLERFNKRNETVVERADIYDKALIINDEFNDMLNSLNEIKPTNK